MPTVENDLTGRQTSSDRRRRHGNHAAYHPEHPLAQSRAGQAVARARGRAAIGEVTRPIDAADVSHAITATPKPSLDAPALAWAEYHEQLAALYRRQAAYEARLAYVDASLSGLSV